MILKPALPLDAELIGIKYLFNYPVRDDRMHGWGVPRNGRITDGVPTFTNPTAMIGASSLGTFEQALETTIRIQQSNVEVSQILLAQAKMDLLAIQTRGTRNA